MGIEDLPPEILINIFLYLESSEAFSGKLISKAFSRVISSELFFKIYFGINTFERVENSEAKFTMDTNCEVEIFKSNEQKIHVYKVYDDWDDDEWERKYKYFPTTVSLKPKMGKFRGQTLLFYYDNLFTVVWKNGIVKKLGHMSGYSRYTYQFYALQSFYSDCLKFASLDPNEYDEDEWKEVKSLYEQHPNLKTVTVNLHPISIFGGERTYHVPDGIIAEEFFLFLNYDVKKKLRFNDFSIHSKLVTSKGKIMKVKEMESLSIFPTIDVSENNMIYIHYFGNGFYEEKMDLEKTSLRDFDVFVRKKFNMDPESFIMIIKGQKRKCSLLPRFQYQLKARRLRSAVEEPESEKITPLSCLLREEGKRSFPLTYYEEKTKVITKLTWDDCISMDVLYKVGGYEKSLKDFGVESGMIIEIFEVTGPSIPVMYCSMVGDANVIDVNPNWNISTFLRYCGIVSGHRQSFSYCEGGKVNDKHNTILKDAFDLQERRRTRKFIRVR